MKSFCVLNAVLSQRAGESVGGALATALGRKIGLLTDGSEPAEELKLNIARGVVAAGGTAYDFGKGFETQVRLFAVFYSLAAGVFISSKGGCLVSVYGSNGKPLNSQQEAEVSAFAAQGANPAQEPGGTVRVDGERTYFGFLLRMGGSFENVSVGLKCENANVRRLIGGALTVLGGAKGERPTIFLSSSGGVISALDENGAVHTNDELHAVCCMCELENKTPLSVGFEAPCCLDSIAKSEGVRLARSFEGGSELWQNDGVLLAAKLLGFMSQRGQSLSVLCGSLPDIVTRRKTLAVSASLDAIADALNGDTVVQYDRGVFTRFNSGAALITHGSAKNRLCLEVQAAASEAADEICADIVNAINLTSGNN